jgi:hypothetical protein
MKQVIVLSIALLGNLTLVGSAYAHHGWYDVGNRVRSYAEFESALSDCSRQFGDDPANAALRKCMLRSGWRWEET